MANLKLSLACWNYDRVRALADGSVRPDGIEIAFQTAPQVGQIMERAMRLEYDVAELGLTYYLRSLELADPPFIAIPVFPNRLFRHSAIFINRDSGIRAPGDLAGKKMGELHRYGHDAGIWAKGVLSDEYGVRADSYSYFIGGMDRPAPSEDWAPAAAPKNVRIHRLAPGQTLDAMLETGEIDALMSAWLPPSLLRRSPKVARLFSDYEAVERDYFRRTGIFPMMHTVVVRRALYDEHPWIAQSLVVAFQKAKEQVLAMYRIGAGFFSPALMIPWVAALQEENRALMGDDPFPYGIVPNRTALDTYLRYHCEQGLSRLWKIEEIFAPETLG
jgi:hypothetical protein